MLVIKSKKNYTMTICEVLHNLFIIKDLQKTKTPLLGAFCSNFD